MSCIFVGKQHNLYMQPSNNLLQNLFDKIKSLESEISELKGKDQQTHAEQKSASQTPVRKARQQPASTPDALLSRPLKPIARKDRSNSRSITRSHNQPEPHYQLAKKPPRPPSDLRLDDLRKYLESNPNEDIPEVIIYF